MTTFNKWLAAAALSTAGLTSISHAQTPLEDFLARSESQLFNTSVLTQPVTTPTVQMLMGQPATSINIDVNAMFSLPDFQIELPGLESFYAVNEKIIQNSIGGDSWIGDVVYLDPTGFDTSVQGRAYFVESDNGITGTIHTADSVIQIYPDGAGGQLVIEQEPEMFDAEDHFDFREDGGEGGTSGAPSIAGRRDGPNVATTTTPYTIDVLWVTTALARSRFDNTEELIELAMLAGNDVLTNSEIPAQLRVVGIYEDSTYSENQSNMSATLQALQNSTDGNIDAIHQLRADLGADIVAAVSGASNLCGTARFDSSYASAFSVTAGGCMSGYTVIHEIGHNFGAAHDVANAGSTSYSFGYGLYNNTDDPYWRTVMSYSCPAGPLGGCPRIPYFSNSQLTYNDIPLGDAESADNSRVLRVRAAEVAGFAPRLTNDCTEHTATNSTHVNEGRAYTETQLFTTNYFAVGSEQQISGYSFSTTTLAEEPAGYFTPGTCNSASGEAQFAPEIQNLMPFAIVDGLRIDGEVFDGNADDIIAVRVRETGASTWTNATISNGKDFSVEITATLDGDISVDFQTEDSEGSTFDFTTNFDIFTGEAPTITLDYSQVKDDSITLSGDWSDPDNSVFDFYYQVDGAGDPDVGTWTQVSVNNTFWSIPVSNLAPGIRTIYLYAEDESGQRSNIVSTQEEIIAQQAPNCLFAQAVPSSSGTNGEVDILGLVSDVNFSDVDIEYRVNSGSWNTGTSFSNIRNREQFWFKLPTAYSDNSVLTIELRSTDSQGLQASCGSQTITVSHPTGDLAPTCEIVEADQFEGVVRFRMTANDPNGNAQQMFGKNSEMTEWIQTWPGPITTHFAPIPNFGSVTVNGRVVDSTDLEGTCNGTVNIVDTQSAPYIEYANGFYSGGQDQVLVDVSAKDFDGDIVAAEVREVGTTTWVSGTADPNNRYGQFWNVNLGTLSSGVYIFEARVTDAGGRSSEIYTLPTVNVEREEPPTLDSLNYSQFGRTFSITGTKSDPNGNDSEVWYQVDSEGWNSFTEFDESFQFWVYQLADGPHTIEVYVEDSFQNRSASQFINLDIDPGVAPVIEDLSYVINGDQAVFTVVASDVDGMDGVRARIRYDGGSSFTDINDGTNTWVFTWDDLSPGPHTAEITVLDEFSNTSPTETINFVIEEQTPCFEDTNSNHETAGRAYIETVGETCIGSFCFGGTDTYFATGSAADLGTSASTTTSLLETSTGYFEVDACNDNVAPVITLIGDNPMTLYQGQAYVEEGATATDNVDGTFGVSDITGTVDTSIVGTYSVDYNATDSSGNAATTVTRTVNVIADDVKPVITIATGTSYSVNLNGSFTNPVPTATDNVDGDISANVVITGSVDTSTVGTYNLYYNVSDAANNAADEVIVTVEVAEQVDSTPPTITLTGSANITITVGDSYSEPGYSATDNVDGDITANVIVAGDVVDPNTVGTYVVTYNVSDAAGNTATEVTRTVTVDPVGGACFTDTIENHVTAGRAEVLYGSSYYTVVPSGQTAEYLGSTFVNSNDVISLEETAPGHWIEATSCN